LHINGTRSRGTTAVLDQIPVAAAMDTFGSSKQIKK